MNIGSIQLRNSLALAPMAGLTDVPFRTIAWELGAGYLVSEMLSSKPELWETGKSRLRRDCVPGVHPVAVQIAGSDPGQMADTAQRLVAGGADIIDINFGCPAKKVCKKAAGSALLNDEAKVARIVARVVQAVAVPVTVKTRTGWSVATKNAVRVAKIVEAAGVSALFLHGRTRACRFTGKAEYDTAKAVKAVLDIPVIVNGDLDAESARRVLAYTQADGLMIGRNAIGAPWVFTVIAGNPAPSLATKWRVILRHLSLMHSFYGDGPAVRIARKHIIAYLHGLGLSREVAPFNRITEAAGQRDFLTRLAALQAA